MKQNITIKLKLAGLDCANCARKIEDKVNQLNEVSEATLNFSTSTLVLTLNKEADKETVIEVIKTLVQQLEPHVVVTEMAGQVEVSSEALRHNIQMLADEKTEIHKMNQVMREYWSLALGTLIFMIAVVTDQPLLFFVSYVLIGYEVLLTAIKNIMQKEMFDENFLMTIATVGAFAIGEYAEGVAVMLFYEVGEMFQSYAVNYSRRSITALLDIKAPFANVLKGKKVEMVAPELVNVDDVIVIKPGERVPLDGVVIEGSGFVDTKALTGESVPRELSEGESILSGYVNQNALLKVHVLKRYEDSTVSKILELVEHASSRKAKSEKFMTKIARYYTPIVVVVASLLAVVPTLFNPASASTWVYRALVFLVVSCPCAIVVSVPLSFFAGLGGASKLGVLIKGGNYLEALANVQTVVLDKTGTLTKGVFNVTKIHALHFTNDEFLRYAAYAESQSHHPIATSILEAYHQDIVLEHLNDYEEIAGHGIKAVVNGHDVLIGNEKLMARYHISSMTVKSIGTVLHLSVDGRYEGYMIISDKLKSSSQQAIKELKALGVSKVVMLTGDRDKVAQAVGQEVGVDLIHSELLPQDKVMHVENLLSDNNSNVLFVGDGLNDAPVLARADIGVAMGGIGSDAAIEAADVVIMNDDLLGLVAGIKKAKQTHRILWQNIIFAFGIKILVMSLGALGMASMWAAVFADVGVTLIAVLNSIRILQNKK